MPDQWEYHSPLGTELKLTRMTQTTGDRAANDYLLAVLGEGSYPSGHDKPLFCVQISLIPVLGDFGVPPAVGTEYSLTLGAAMSDAALRSKTQGRNFATEMARLKADGSTHFGIDQDAISPEKDNQTTTHVAGWGITIPLELSGGVTASGPMAGGRGGATLSFTESESRQIHDLELYPQSHEANRDHAVGTIWTMIFTRKDGMNLASFRPRCDSLFSCNKRSLQSGRMHFLLVERLIYWGEWAEPRDLTIGETTGIGTGIGAALAILFTGGLALPILAAAGAASGAIGGAAAGKRTERQAHNDLIDHLTHGDPASAMLMLQVAAAAKKGQVAAALLELDLDRGEMTVLGRHDA